MSVGKDDLARIDEIKEQLMVLFDLAEEDGQKGILGSHSREINKLAHEYKMLLLKNKNIL